MTQPIPIIGSERNGNKPETYRWACSLVYSRPYELDSRDKPELDIRQQMCQLDAIDEETAVALAGALFEGDSQLPNDYQLVNGLAMKI